LTPLPLDGGELADLRSAYEPYRNPDPYAPLWRKLTANRRPSFEMDPIVWGAFPGLDVDDDPTCDAAELAEVGDSEGAREILMELLCTDSRCIDAHAHLGNLEFPHAPEHAIVHYEMGIRIGELSLPPNSRGELSDDRAHRSTCAPRRIRAPAGLRPNVVGATGFGTCDFNRVKRDAESLLAVTERYEWRQSRYWALRVVTAGLGDPIPSRRV
jgi:hypothetical protein